MKQGTANVYDERMNKRDIIQWLYHIKMLISSKVNSIKI